jgi:hypothetical protein
MTGMTGQTVTNHAMEVRASENVWLHLQAMEANRVIIPRCRRQGLVTTNLAKMSSIAYFRHGMTGENVTLHAALVVKVVIEKSSSLPLPMELDVLDPLRS